MDFTKNIDLITKRCADHYKTMIEIVLSEIDDDDKILQVCRSILEYNRDRLINDNMSTVEQIKDSFKLGSEPIDLKNAQSKMDEMESMARVMDTIAKVTSSHRLRIQYIGEVMLSIGSPEEKVEKISVCLF